MLYRGKQMKEEKILEKIYEHSKPYLKLMSYYKCAMMEIETKFNVLNEQYSLEKDRNPISSIKTRLKSALSIEEKLKRRCFENTLEAIENNLYDVAGIRVICNLPEDVYALAEAFLKQDDVKLIQIKDYIKNPKPNGYRSLHLIVAIPIFLADEKKIMKAEIQLRTIAMDFWASLEHQLRYKKEGEFTEEIAKELYECAETSAQLDLKMQSVRRKIENS
jgi:putative GTP pyrophosphokinase